MSSPRFIMSKCYTKKDYYIMLLQYGHASLEKLNLIDKFRKVVDGIIAILATTYSIWVIISGTADIKTLAYGMGLILSGTLFYGPLAKTWRSQIKQEKKSA
jgi:hypothetical protein